MQDMELGWVVGMLEGEGCFSIHTTKRGEKQYRSARIQMNSTDEDVVMKLAALVGGKVSGPSYYKDKPHWKPRYSWALYGKNARALMTMIHPYMGERRQAAIVECLALQ